MAAGPDCTDGTGTHELTSRKRALTPRSPSAAQIRPNLPPRLRISTKWTLLYSLDQHGISIATMYERMRVGLRGSDSGVVIVVKDSAGSVFGAYVNEGLKESKTYYGDGSWFDLLSAPPQTSLTRPAVQFSLEVDSIPAERLPRRVLDQVVQVDRQELVPRPL